MIQATDGNFYGSCSQGGASGDGVVYKITSAGTFSVVHSFTNTGDGAGPEGGVIQARDGNLYGVTGLQPFGWSFFKIDLTGAFTAVASYIGFSSGGAAPRAGLTQGSDGAFYGTTAANVNDVNGDWGYVFRVTADGNMTNLHTMDPIFDGDSPRSPLIQATDGNLYGANTADGPAVPFGGADFGNALGGGTLFRLSVQTTTTTTLTSSANPASVGQPVVLTASISPAAAGGTTPSGTVEFFQNGTSLGTAIVQSTGAATFATYSSSGLLPGTYSFSATYSGDANFIGSSAAPLSQVVNGLSGSTMTALTVPNPAPAGTAALLTATVAPLSGSTNPAGVVQFFDGSTLLGSAGLVSRHGQMVASISQVFSTPGSQTLVAVFVPQGGSTLAGSQSVPTELTVYSATGSAPLASVTTVQSPLTATYGSPVTSTATVVAARNNVKSQPSGTVQFFVDGLYVGSGALSGGTASFVTSGVMRGVHEVSANYTGDGTFAGSTSLIALLDVQ